MAAVIVVALGACAAEPMTVSADHPASASAPAGRLAPSPEALAATQPPMSMPGASTKPLSMPPNAPPATSQPAPPPTTPMPMPMHHHHGS
jgi:hypothetical protein